MNFFHHDSQRRLGLVLAFGALVWSGTYNALAKGLTPYLSPMTLLLLSALLYQAAQRCQWIAAFDEVQSQLELDMLAIGQAQPR